MGCAWSDDGGALLVLAADGTLHKLTRAPHGTRVRHTTTTTTTAAGAHDAAVWVAAVPHHAEGLVLTAHAGGTVRLWDAQLRPVGRAHPLLHPLPDTHAGNL